MTADKHLPPNWTVRLLAVLAAPEAPGNLDLLTAWARAEGGTAQWNPLNTTLRLEGSWNYNSVGVQNFARPIIGISATALTLANGYYNGILGDLQNGGFTAVELVTRNKHEYNVWGTGAENVLRLLT